MAENAAPQRSAAHGSCTYYTPFVTPLYTTLRLHVLQVFVHNQFQICQLQH